MTLDVHDAGRPRAGEPSEEELPAAGAVALIPRRLDAVLVLLRHGETEAIVENRFQGQMETPLTAFGERQIDLAARRLAQPGTAPALPVPAAPPLAIVHSPLVRAARSAEIVAGRLREAGAAVAARPDGGFSEIGQGDWEGLTTGEIQTRYGPELAAWRRWPGRAFAPGGESLAAVQARVEPALERVLAELASRSAPGSFDRDQVLGYAGRSDGTEPWTLIVAHAGVFRVVVCTLLGLSTDHFWNFDFGLGSISVVEIRAGRAVLRALNLDAHLASLASGSAGPADHPERDATGAL